MSLWWAGGWVPDEHWRTVLILAQLCVPLWDPMDCVAHQAPLSMGFPRQECWCGLPFPTPEDLPNPEIQPCSPALHADSLRFGHQGSPVLALSPTDYMSWLSTFSPWASVSRLKLEVKGSGPRSPWGSDSHGKPKILWASTLQILHPWCLAPLIPVLA